jgi:excisionase family DNA binding protein
MLTVPEAARRIDRDPETIRRWIRSGRLPSQQVGTQYIIDESDLLEMVGSDMLPLPQGWQTTASGEPMPDVVKWLARSRRDH